MLGFVKKKNLLEMKNKRMLAHNSSGLFSFDQVYDKIHP